MDSMLGLFFDISILTVITLSALLGLRKGLFISLTGTIRSILCIILAIFISRPFADIIADYSTLDESLISHIDAGIESAVSDSSLFDTLPYEVHTMITDNTDSIILEIATNAGNFVVHIIAFLVLLFVFRVLSSIIVNLSIFSSRKNPVGCANALLGFAFGTLKGYLLVCIIMLMALPVLAILGPELSLSIVNGFKNSYTGPFLFMHNPILYLLNLY